MANTLKILFISVCLLAIGTHLQAEILTATKQAGTDLSQKSMILTKALLSEIKTQFKEEKRPDKLPDKKKKKTPDTKPDKKKKKKPDTKPDKKKKKKKTDQEKKTVIDWEKHFDNSMDKFDTQFDADNKQFSNAYRKSNEKWEKERKAFIKRLDDYIGNLVDPETLSPSTSYSVSSSSPQISSVISTAELNSFSYHIIPGAFDVPVRDQGRRGTCAAFTAIRAYETIAAVFNKKINLSEQYFYWSSKPECQKQTCANGGSWYGKGLVASQQARSFDVPLEAKCPYVTDKVANNETQIPLKKSCRSGVAKALDFKMVKNNQILGEITNNHPVMGAFKLSPNFYKSRGVISFKDSLKDGKKDEHAGGHAILLVGYVKLPAEYHAAEGEVCYVTANSWSEGWGKGGYACLTQKWVDEYSLAHMSLTSIELSPSVF
jgi:C1A family cysteine protease